MMAQMGGAGGAGMPDFGADASSSGPAGEDEDDDSDDDGPPPLEEA